MPAFGNETVNVALFPFAIKRVFFPAILKLWVTVPRFTTLKVTDPFGRFATFTYTRFGQLASITDVLGMTSSFGYVSDDFISMLTTPYGTTTFRHVTIGNPRLIEATDPLGGTAPGPVGSLVTVTAKTSGR